MNSATRYQNFRSQMILKGLKWDDIADLLGISKQGSIMAIQRETIKAEHYGKLVEAGFSKSVLPSPTK